MNKFLALAADSERFIAKVQLPSGQTAVIAEGDPEARSIGSLSVRLYDAAPPGDETTFFRAGIVRPVDRTVEKIMLGDIDGDQWPENIVLVRSTGTGRYLSAQASFSTNEEKLIRCNPFVANGDMPDSATIPIFWMPFSKPWI